VTRLAVIDDDDINRLGMTQVLNRSPDIEVIASLTHREALEGDDWLGADVVVVDAADCRMERDQFPGVAVVARARRWRGRGQRPTIVVITAHFFNDAVRCRMREAGADLFHYRGDLLSAGALREAVLLPPLAAGPPPAGDEEAVRRLGVTEASRVNRGLEFALRNDLDRLLTERPVRRTRTLMRLRQRFNREARLTPTTTLGHLPDRVQDAPSVPQIDRFLAWATRARPPR
jgi:CheY-like chemotaxis protein